MLEKMDSREIEEGSGARAYRLLGEGIHLDHFVLFDEYFIPSDASFPMHGHGGFEGVQFLMEGGTEYKDNHDNHGIITSMGARRFSAGPGFQHSEHPISDGPTRGYLLWIKLPSGNGWEKTTYQQMEPREIPLVVEDGFRKRTIVGRGSSMDTRVRVIFKHIISIENGVMNIYVKRRQNGFIYLSRGRISLDRIDLKPGDGLRLEEGRVHSIDIGVGTEFVYAVGDRIDEPIVQDGGYVR